MPIWAIIYAVLVAGISFFGLFSRDETKNLREDVYNFISHAVLLVPFSGYWVPGVVQSVGVAFPFITVAAMCWEFFGSPTAIRRLWNDPTLSEKERTLLLVAGSLFMVPLYATAAIGLVRFFD